MLKPSFDEPKFRVCCLGGLQVTEAGSGTDMTPANRKTRALIGYLCVVGKPVGRERLAALLWSDRGDEQARASLRQAIYELRSLLGGDRMLRTERDTVGVAEGVGTDIASITEAARSGDLEQLDGALAAWRGKLFDDLPSVDPEFDAWLRSERVRVQERLIEIAAEAADTALARGEVDAARRIVSVLQERDGTNEFVLRLGLRLDHAKGDTAGRHRRYKRFRALLKSELDAAPAAETQQLFLELANCSAPAAIPAAVVGAAPGGAAQKALQDSQTAPAAMLGQRGHADKRQVRPALLAAHLFAVRTTAAAAAVLAILVVALAWALSGHLLRSAAPPKEQPLLAVLPFQNLSDDPGLRYFSDGMTEEIADELLRKKQIPVARTRSVSPTREGGAPESMSATLVLSGSLERVGDRLHVIVELMDVHDDRVIWSRGYDSPLAQSPTLRRRIALRITGALERVFASGAFGQAQHSAAYDHYRKGRALYVDLQPRAAAAELESAVRLAPNFAGAWSALAAARRLLAVETLLVPGQTYNSSLPRAARAAAERALALEPANGEALGVLALLIPSTRLPEIDRRLQQALRIEPDNAQLMVWHGEFLIYVGRNHDALGELERAYQLDRATPFVALDLVLAALKSGRWEEAREIIDLADPGRDDRMRGAFFHLRTKYYTYRRDWFGLASLLSVLPDFLSPEDAAYFRLCRETASALASNAVDRFGSLRAAWRSEVSLDSDDAVHFLSALSDSDGALQVVQSAVAVRRNGALLVDPGWEALFAFDLVTLRTNGRFPGLISQWGLSDYWRATKRTPDFMR